MFLQALAPGLQITGDQTLLIQLATQQLGLLLRLRAAPILFAHLLIHCFHSLTGQAQILFDLNALLEQAFQFDTLIFLRRLALFDGHFQLFTPLSQTLGLGTESLQPLGGRILLGPQRLHTQRQLVRLVLMLASMLTGVVECFTHLVALAQ